MNGEKRKIAVVTGSRADYGHLYWLMKEIQGDVDLQLLIVTTGMHLSPEFGLTYRLIEEDGFTISRRVETLLSSDTPAGIAKSTGLGVLGFADAFEVLQPHIIVLLGDRFETLAAATAGMLMGLPIAHIHGGEVSEGALDDSIRHAITKMAHLHFTATELYRQRIIQLGELPDRVFCFGAPGLDAIEKTPLLSREELEVFYELPLDRTTFLVTFHPVTREGGSEQEQADALLAALDRFSEAQAIFTMPNADAGRQAIGSRILAFADRHGDKVRVYTALGQVRYLSTLRHVDLVLGNSSSGLIETPSFGISTVNIGDRQKGRVMAPSVICCEPDKEHIVAAIEKALSPGFRAIAKQAVNPYGKGGASKKIKDVLKTAVLDMDLMKKPFHDLTFQHEEKA